MAAGFLKKFLSFTKQPNDVALPEVNFDLRIARAIDVEKVWKSVQAEATAQGKYPVFLGKQSELPLLLELAEYEERDVDTLTKEGLRLDVAQWFENQFTDHHENFPYPFDEKITQNVFSSFKPFSQAYGLRGKPIKENVIFGLLPVLDPWLAPAYFKIGGVNDCPPTEVHVALLHYWFERYGARPITVSYDVVECTVERPPTTMEEALNLAKEQYIYCPDNVWQGLGSGGNLAKWLLNNHYWYFWWD